MELTELMEPPTAEIDTEHEKAHEASPTARVIATSHVSIAVGDLIYAAKLLGQGHGFDGLHTIEQAMEHLKNACHQLNGTVWEISSNTMPSERLAM